MQVEVLNLKKHFGKTRAVDGVSFGFSSGQIVAFVGPNGAGKTTAMRIMATLDEPTDGDVYLNGISVVQDPEKARRMVGFMPDFLPTHRDITVDDYLDFYARAFHIRHDRRRTVIDEIEQFTNLVGIRHKFLDALSKGMKQRLSLARALIHDPQVLILDEPAAGLDPRARIELRELLKALREQSKAVLVSSHILAELAEICDSVVVIEKGKVLTSGRLSEITTKNVPHRTVKIRSLSPNGQLKKKLLEIPRVLKARDVGDGVEVDIEGTEQDLSNLVTRLVNEGIPLVEVRHMSSGLESIFMNITKGELA